MRTQRASGYALTVAMFGGPTPSEFVQVKTMYGGKAVRPGDALFLLTAGARGALIARGVIEAATSVPRTEAPRQTPRVSIRVAGLAPPARPLARADLRAPLPPEGPEAELDFKLYRQATPKLVGLTPATLEFLHARF